MYCMRHIFDMEDSDDDGTHDRIEVPVQQGCQHPGYLPYRMMRIMTVLCAAVRQHVKLCRVGDGGLRSSLVHIVVVGHIGILHALACIARVMGLSTMNLERLLHGRVLCRMELWSSLGACHICMMQGVWVYEKRYNSPTSLS